MAAAKTIVILGGGIGGIVAARFLRKHLPSIHRVVLVEQETRNSCPAKLSGSTR